MLSRTADSLFWMGRYTERAANLARGLAVTGRMASLSAALGQEGAEWRSLLVASGGEQGFLERHPAITPEAVIDWLLHDRSNPSSILSCFEAARRNARAVRTALTVDMWGALNDTWNRLRSLAPGETEGEALPAFLEWVRERVLLFNGAAQDTMLRGEPWLFVQLGTALERADNTARLLDVRHGWLAGGATAEYAQWQAVLASLSATRSYQWVYRDRLDPRRIAELVILRPELPRSLVACFGRVKELLEAIATQHGGRRGECHRMAGAMHAELAYGRLEDILAGGLHEFLTRIIRRTAELGEEIERFYIRPGAG
ncbi:MAG: alpha-E domain-containing protein [Rhodovarius sp.]|nr:alpha-E domain-containing protein [Rhodovarius sp.]MCX7932894.1 alpha-E domain-containing protein [Rhodovarius sp.]MDW8313638.1 alpha-E domain-containing protein [Rhodovarius sp.]